MFSVRRLVSMAVAVGLLVCSGSSALWGADGNEAKPAAEKKAAVDKETVAKAKALVKQLGDTSYDKREAAQKALAEMGVKALPAIKVGAKSTDAEVAERCSKLLKSIVVAADEKDVPEIPESLRQRFRSAWDGAWGSGKGGGSSSVSISVNVVGGANGIVQEVRSSGGGGSRTIGNNDGKVTISIKNGAIKLIVAPTGGEAKTYNYKAESKEQFAKKYPKFHKKYLK